MNLWKDLPTGNINAVIEVTKGTKKKYEIDKSTGKFKLERMCKSPMPINYGFIPKTLAQDNDPLDVLVYADKLPKGLVLEVRPLALLKMIDNKIPDPKVLVVPKTSKLKFKDIPKTLLEDIKFFLAHDKGKKTKVFKWLPTKKAKEEIQKSKARYKKCFTNSN